MRILWDANNTAHIARHGVTPELAERIIAAGQPMRTPSSHRYIIETEMDGRNYRLVLDIANDGTVYPVTAFPIRKIRH
jgi:hypothetical protein